MTKVFKDGSGAALNGYDVVGYFFDKKALIGNPGINYKFNDAEWYFENEDHLKIFSGDPEKYFPQFGGFCAYGISANGKLYPTDPAVWKIVNGKLYLNLNKNYAELWEKDLNENIEKGNKAWEEIKSQENSASSSEKIKTAFEQNEKTLKKMPSLGQKAGKVKVTANDGLVCNIESGKWKFKADMSKKSGGTQSAPSPGIYEAGALGSCITIMAKMWGAKLNVPIDNIEIEVEFDSDSRFLYNIDNVPARWKAIRYNIKVESSASEKDINKVLDLAHQQSHVRGDLEHSFNIERRIKILNHN